MPRGSRPRPAPGGREREAPGSAPWAEPAPAWRWYPPDMEPRDPSTRPGPSRTAVSYNAKDPNKDIRAFRDYILDNIGDVFLISQQFPRNAAHDDVIAVKQLRHRLACSCSEALDQFFVCHPGKVGFANQSAKIGPGGQRQTLACHVFRASQPQAVPENSRALATQQFGTCWIGM